MRSFYQDRLATNIGKAALKTDYLPCFFLRSYNASEHDYKAALRRQYGERFKKIYEQYPLERFHGAFNFWNLSCPTRLSSERARATWRNCSQPRVSASSRRLDVFELAGNAASAFLQTNSDERLFCPSKRIADLVSRAPGRNSTAYLYYFSRGPRPGDWVRANERTNATNATKRTTATCLTHTYHVSDLNSPACCVVLLFCFVFLCW